MNYKKIIALILAGFLCLDFAGCTGAFRKKFVRKKQDKAAEGPVLAPQDYSKEFTNKQFYANHFAFWKNAEAELFALVDTRGNQKRIKLYSRYSTSEIRELHRLLVDEKRKEIEPYITELDDIVKKATDPSYLSSHKNLVSETLRKHLRMVNKKFSYPKMQKYIREELPAQLDIDTRPSSEVAEKEESLQETGLDKTSSAEAGEPAGQAGQATPDSGQIVADSGQD